jgi:probable F420-dependent oxidoreductase
VPIENLILAALGPRMLQLAAERASGAHPYFVPVEYTALAREIMGPDALLIPEQGVVLESDPQVARAIARNHMELYLSLPNYTSNLNRLGFEDDEIKNGGSDRLVDTIIAWGDVDAIVERVDEHIAAGASSVCVQVLNGDSPEFPLTQNKDYSHRCKGCEGCKGALPFDDPLASSYSVVHESDFGARRSCDRCPS